MINGAGAPSSYATRLNIVANNIANVNTSGYKADKSLFEEYLNTPAHEDNFAGGDQIIRNDPPMTSPP